jgi:heme-degrading monooxygenase HmoA
MVLEQAILSIDPAERESYERSLKQALPLIAATPGFERFEMRPCLENEGVYLLLVWWQSLEAHTQGFRGSDRYQEWRKLLHRYYQPFPKVLHFGEPVATA